MAVIYPLNHPPAPAAAVFTVGPFSAVGLQTAPHSLKQTVEAFDGKLWGFDIGLPLMKRPASSPWTAFVVAMNGLEGTALIGDPDAKTPLGVATGTPQVDGAHASGVDVLNTKLWTPSVTGIMKAGDYLQVGSGETTRLHLVLDDADSDSGGLAALNIWPDVREALANDDAITVNAAKGTFRFASKDNGWTTDRQGFYDFSLTFIEAVGG